MQGNNIRSSTYSNIHVYEMSVRGTAVMIRKSDGFVNATQILRAAGLPKPARTKVLEREVTRGVHEKVQGGYAGSQGTWIPLESAISLAEQYNIYQECAPLFTYDMASGAAEAASPPQKTRRVALKTTYSDASSPDESTRERRRIPAQFVKEPSPVSESVVMDVEEQIEISDLMPIEIAKDGSGSGESKQSPPQPPAALTPRREQREARTKVRKNFAEEEEEDEYYSDLSAKPKRQRQQQDQDFSNTESPMAGKKCQSCGVTETPQWRRGPSGKRTLCNACGVKWASGRLHVPAIVNYQSSPLSNTVSESEINPSSDHGSGIDEPLEVGSTAWKLQLEVQRLKSKLRETEKNQKKLERVLKESKDADKEMDRCYRKILSGAKKSHPRLVSSKKTAQIDNLFHRYQEERDGDLADVEDEDVTFQFGDSTERNRAFERRLVTSFLDSMKKRNALDIPGH